MTRTPRLAIGAAAALVALGGTVGGFALTAGGRAAPTPLRLAGADAPTTTVTSPAPGGEVTFAAGEAGTVTVARTASGLHVVAADAADGWASAILRPDGREVAVRFQGSGRTVEFEAELDDGLIKVKVRERPAATTTTTAAPASSTTSPASAPTTGAPAPAGPAVTPTTGAPDVRVVSAGDAGSITVAIVGRSLELRSVDPADGWTARVDDLEADEVEVRFTRDTRRVDLKVELEDGALRVRLEARTDDPDDDLGDNSGPGSSRSRHDDGGRDGRHGADDRGGDVHGSD
jgi:hypothetical protein